MQSGISILKGRAFAFPVLCLWGALFLGVVGCEAKFLSLGDECLLGEAGCPPGEACQRVEGLPAGRGKCLPLGGGPVGEGGVLKAWRLLQEGEEVLALGEENAQAGWLGAGAWELEIFTEGPLAGAGLRVLWGGEEAACGEAEAQGAEVWRWRCWGEGEGPWAKGEAGIFSEVEMEVFWGEGVERRRYRVDVRAPGVGFELVGPEGGALRLCAWALEEEGAPAASVWVGDMALSSEGSSLELAWEEEEGSAPTRVCRRAVLPEAVAVGAFQLSAEVGVRDVAHNVATTREAGPFEVRRVAVEAQLVDEAQAAIVGFHMPLLWTGGRLVLANSDEAAGSGHVYFYNPADGVLSASENVGPLSGLAALGDSGRVAISTLESAQRRSRTSVLGPDGRFLAPDRGTDCVRGEGGLSTYARFQHGLSLLEPGHADGTGPWRFAVPLNDVRGASAAEAANGIITYVPYGSEGSALGHCRGMASGGALWPIAPPLGLSTSEVVMFGAVASSPAPPAPDVHHVFLFGWSWNGAAFSWSPSGGGTYGFFQAASLQYQAGSVAAGEGHLWLTWRVGTGEAARWRLLRTTALNTDSGVPMSAEAADMGGVALDESGRAYVVARALSSPDSYELRRYASNMEDNASAQAAVPLPQGAASPVGSPLLGQPVGGGAGEIYVVMTDGRVYAFSADELTLLWTEALGIGISPEAQPVLRGNRLWLIGTNGALRALRVNSNGLHRTAQWPKKHRDNCNSNSRAVSSGQLPSCF